MSLYDKASLALIPSGTKASTLYSVLPANGNGDFDHTRATSATRVNKDGLIESVGSNVPRLDYPLIDGVVQDCPALLLEPSRTNLITDYTGAGFTAFNGASITANDSVSPDGSTNATLMTTTGSANELIQQASISISSGQSYTISGYFKLKSGTLNDPDNGFKGLDGFSGGVVSSIFNASVTSEWKRLSFTVTSTTTSGRIQIKCEDAAEILIWGLQVELGSYETSIIPTSGSTVTRNADVCNGAGTSAEFNDIESSWFIEIQGLAEDNTNKYISISDGGGSPYTNSLSIQYRNNGTLRIFHNGLDFADAIFIGGSSFDLTENHKIAIRFKENDMAVYIDGVSQSLNGSFVYQSISGLDTLSFEQPNAGNAFYGKVKQLMVFNEALTDAELTTLTS